jgi:eIF3 subunit 6 N terminal domain
MREACEPVGVFTRALGALMLGWSVAVDLRGSCTLLAPAAPAISEHALHPMQMHAAAHGRRTPSDMLQQAHVLLASALPCISGAQQARRCPGGPLLPTACKPSMRNAACLCTLCPQERGIYKEDDILKAKIALLQKTNMVDFAMDIYKELYQVRGGGGNGMASSCPASRLGAVPAAHHALCEHTSNRFS